VFKNYESIPYTFYKSNTNQKNYVDLLRQKINNIYSTMCDGSVCVYKEYMDLLKTPKQLYYRWQSGIEEFNSDELSKLLVECLQCAEEVKQYHAKTKLKVSWSEYKNIIAGFLRKIFDNYIPLDEYEDKNRIVLDIDIWTEDNFIISYFCKSLSGYMKDYQKEYYGIKKLRNMKLQRCECGGLFIQNKNNSRRRCNLCNKYQPIGTKIIVCIDCDREVKVDARNMTKTRCNSCQSLRDKELKKTRNKRYYETKK
jgi:hypothetical protein